MNFPQKARRELRHHGLTGLLKSGPPYVLKQLRGLPYFFLQDRIFERKALKEYCINQGTCWQYQEGCQVEITADVTVGSVPQRFRQLVATYDVESSYVFELPDATLLGEHATAVTASDDIVLESTRGKHTKLHNAIAEPSFPRIAALRGPSRYLESDVREYECVFPLVLPKTSFFVWIAEYLPKLQAWKHYVEQTGEQPTVLLWEDAPSWMRESVELLGVEQIEQTQFEMCKVERLVLGTHRYHNVGIDYNPHCPAEYRWLGGQIRESVSEKGSERIYISRADAKRRRMTNEPDVMELLDNYGFERVTLAGKPFSEQVQTIAGAETILSLHGAGLAHLLWADEPTVIEIVPDSYPRPAFFCLAQVLGLDYAPVMAETTDDSIPPKERDVVVDVEQLKNVLKQIRL